MLNGSLMELECVAAVASRGGFRAAARELGVSSSAISHAIGSLEARLGIRLFNRTTRSVSLSAAGEQFVAEIMPALAAIRGAVEGVDEHRAEPSGTLRLNTSLGAARMILQPLVLAYLRRYPKMKLEIVTEGALVDIVGQGFDAGLRLVETIPPDMIAVPVTDAIRSVIVATPDYFDRYPPPKVPGDLMAHNCIRSRMASGAIYRWELEGHGESLTIDVPGSLTLDDSDLMLRAAQQSAGLAYLTEGSVADDLQAGRLVQVLDDWTPPYPGLCLYYPGRRYLPAKLRAFIDLIHETRKQRVGR